MNLKHNASLGVNQIGSLVDLWSGPLAKQSRLGVAFLDLNDFCLISEKGVTNSM